MQQTFTVSLNGPDCLKKIKEINLAAKKLRMPRSQFILWLYEDYRTRAKGKEPCDATSA